MNNNGPDKPDKPPVNILKITKDQWPFIVKLLVIAFLGIVILNFAHIFNAPKQTTSENITDEYLINQNLAEETPSVSEEIALEKRLENILAKIEGVGDVSVSIVYAEGSTREYAINVSTTAKEIQEKDQSGGLRTTNEKTESGQMVIEGNSQPVLVKESMPIIQGVLIVAAGVENPLVKEKLFKAVQTLLQIPAHRVTICSRNGGS